MQDSSLEQKDVQWRLNGTLGNSSNEFLDFQQMLQNLISHDSI